MSLLGGLGPIRKMLGKVLRTPAKERHQRTLALIEQSTLFDRDWYLATYADVRASGVDPVRHYLDNGWREGRDPGPGFSTTAYLKAHSDVAVQHINPLLHYVEYGHSEGRGAPDHSAPAARAFPPRPDFAAAAPCVSYPVSTDRAVSWRRGAEFDRGTSNIHRLDDGLAIGFSADDRAGAAVQRSLDYLAVLSGAGEPGPRIPIDTPSLGEAHLIDAWHTAQNRLRTRWRGPHGHGPMVVRIIQQVDGRAEMVGEGLLAFDLNVVDAKMVNQYFPLLYVFTDPDGLIAATRLIAFPSLCRGGLHHAEIMANGALDGAKPANPISAGMFLADQLLTIRAGDANALVGRIEVDLSGATGTHPIFQANFQKWLAEVARVGVEPIERDAAGPTGSHLARSVRVPVGPASRLTGGKLVLGGDMAPSISALSAVAGAQGCDADEVALSVLISGENDSQPSLLIRPPLAKPMDRRPDFAPSFPSFRAAPVLAPATPIAAFALRPPVRPGLSSAQWLVPVSPPMLVVSPSRTPITWLMVPGDWSAQLIVQSLESLAAQRGGGPASILFVGSPPDEARDLARRLFRGRVQSTDRIERVASLIRTPLAGFIGKSVILHDWRTAGVLSQLLEDRRNISATVPIVAVDRRGKGFVVAPTGSGVEIRAGTPPLSAQQITLALTMMWRSTWSSSTPSRDLWLARTEQLPRLIEGNDGSAPIGSHIFSSFVTASHLGQRSSGMAPIVLKVAAPGQAVEFELVA